MSTFTCTECNKSFSTALGLAGHSRMHGTSGGTNKQIMCCCVITKNVIKASTVGQYQESLSNCKHCNKLFKSEYKAVFCSKSCSTTFTNQFKVKTESSKQSTSDSLNEYFRINPNPKKHLAKPLQVTKGGTLSYVCKHCSETFESKIKKKYCSNCAPLYMAEARNRYKFTFNIFKYPELFDLKLIQEVGFYAPRGKSGRWNPEGLSRDHKVSVNESIINQYDPYYITHPLNCELMPHSVNNRKKTKSSIKYQDLVSIVDDYELNKLK